MNISFEDKKVYRKDFENGVRFSTRIFKKDVNGNYQSTFIEVKFKKGTLLENETIISGNGFISFYFDKNNKPVFYIFVNEYMENILEPTTEYQVKTNDLPDEMNITDDDLPF